MKTIKLTDEEYREILESLESFGDDSYSNRIALIIKDVFERQ